MTTGQERICLTRYFQEVTKKEENLKTLFSKYTLSTLTHMEIPNIEKYIYIGI